MEVIDFLNMRRQQKFEEEKYLNPIEIRIENDRVQSIMTKYRKNSTRFRLEGLLFSSNKEQNRRNIFSFETYGRRKIFAHK